MRDPVCIALIGAGYWGKKLLAKFLAAPDFSVKLVCDINPQELEFVRDNYSGVTATRSYSTVLNDPDIQAVIVATPPATHFSLAREAIEARKHVWIEKPLSTRLEEGSLLVRLARGTRRILFVDHTFLYDPAVRTIRNLIVKGELGEIYHLFFQRSNLGRIKRDSNVWWNSAPHDVSILLYLISAEPVSVTVHGHHYLQPGVEDLNIAALEMSDGTSAFIYHNWLYPENTAKLAVIGSKSLVMYEGKFDKREATVYEYAIDNVSNADALNHPLPNTIPSRVIGKRILEGVEAEEPLTAAIADFLRSIREERDPLSDGSFSLKVLAVLEAGAESLQSAGKRVNPRM